MKSRLPKSISMTKIISIILITIAVIILLVATYFIVAQRNIVFTETENINIDTVKNGEEIETENISIIYGSTTVEDPDLEYGKTSTRSFGFNGRKVVTYRVVYENGEEVSRKVIKEDVIEAPQDEVIAKGTKIVWRCIDATSYDKNPYNDNKCTNSLGEIKYVSDSQSIQLDPTYSPGKSGANYYNNK